MARMSRSRVPRVSLALTVKSPIEVKLEDGQILVTRPDDERESRLLHGLTRTLIANQIIGRTDGYTKGLEVVGTGYRVQAKGNSIEFASSATRTPSRSTRPRASASRWRATTSSP